MQHFFLYSHFFAGWVERFNDPSRNRPRMRAGQWISIEKSYIIEVFIQIG